MYFHWIEVVHVTESVLFIKTSSNINNKQTKPTTVQEIYDVIHLRQRGEIMATLQELN